MKKLVLFLMLLCLGSMIDSKAEIVTIQTEDQFEVKLDLREVVVAVFWADWCGPCRMLWRQIEMVNAGLGTFDYFDVCFAKCNVDNPDIASLVNDYKISKLPTMLFFKDGQVVEVAMGALSKFEIERILERIR